MANKKKGGLGASAWFEDAEAVPGTAPEEQATPPATPRTRKTFVISPDTYYLLSKMKVEAQRGEGKTITLGDLVDEAVQDLATKRNIHQ